MASVAASAPGTRLVAFAGSHLSRGTSWLALLLIRGSGIGCLGRCAGLTAALNILSLEWLGRRSRAGPSDAPDVSTTRSARSSNSTVLHRALAGDPRARPTAVFRCTCPP